MYGLKGSFQSNDSHFKKGWGFGHTERRVFDKSKYAYIPAPDNYYNGKTYSEFSADKQPEKCTFGEPWARMRKRGDILNSKNIDFLSLDTISPANYNPSVEKVKRFTGAFTCRPRFKRPEDHHIEKRSGPGPQVYTVEDKLVKQTRFVNVLAGGHAKKDSLVIDKNPGPGEYVLPNTLADVSLMKAKYSKPSLMSKQHSVLSQSVSVISSPRECAFSVPLMGDPFTPIGFIKPMTSSYNRRDFALMSPLRQSVSPSEQERDFVNRYVP